MSDKRTWQGYLRAATVSFMVSVARLNVACFFLSVGAVTSDGGFDERR